MVAVGLISYSLYLWHWPVLVLGRYALLRELHLYETFGLIALSCGLAVVSLRYVEAPFRRSGQAPTAWRGPLIATVATIALTWAAAAAIQTTNGLAFRFPGYQVADTEGGGAGRDCMLNRRQGPEAWNERECTLTDGAGPRVLLWGDSLASHYTSGLLAAAEDVEATYLLYSLSECLPAIGYEYSTRPTCGAFNRNVLSMVDAHDVDIVVMAARWELAYKRHDERAADLVASTVDILRERGVEVFIVGQSPIFPAPPEDLLLRRAGAQDEVGRVATDVAEQVNAWLAPSFRGAQFIDPDAYFSPQGQSAYWNGSEYLFRDTVHLSRTGSEEAVRHYMPFVVSGEPEPAQ